MLRVLGVIPARGGSKGIPKKNIKPLAGLPLIAYSIRAAKKSRYLTDCIVSSDNTKIISVSRKYGAVTPFTRPSRLATDRASSLSVLKHAVNFMEKKQGRYDFIVLLQPTAPLRTSQDIDRSIMLLRDSKADSVISVSEISDPHPGKTMQIHKGTLKPFLPKFWHEGIRRQDLPRVFALNGAVYAVRRDTLMKKHSLWGKKSLAYVMPVERSVNIDSKIDLALAELYLRKKSN